MMPWNDDVNYPTAPPTDGWDHPGIRVGQTWRVSTGGAFTITEHDELREKVTARGYTTIDAFFCGGAWIPALELQDLLTPTGERPDIYAVLIADVCCPWFAPWDSRWPAMGRIPPYRLAASNDLGVWDNDLGVWEVIAVVGGKETYIGRVERHGAMWAPVTYDNRPICPVPVQESRAVGMVLRWWEEQGCVERGKEYQP